MLKLDNFLFFLFWLSACFLIALLRHLTSDNVMTLKTMEWLGNLELILTCMEIFYLALFVYLLYCCFCCYWASFRRFGALEMLVDIFLVCAYAFLVFGIVPTFLYYNSILTLVNLFAHNYSDITAVLPEANDFIKFCVEGQPVSKEQVPPMGGHIIVAGDLNGNKYLCANLKAAINQLDVPNVNKIGLSFSKDS